MGRPPRRLPASSRAPHAKPPAADPALRAVQGVAAPLVRLLLAAGVDYTQLAAALKPVFLEQAQAQLLGDGERDTDSALSLRSGVHRKDVRQWRANGLRPRIAQEVSVASQVFARWMQDPRYRDRRRRPRALPRSGPEPSFETLAGDVTRDVHAYTVLSELLHLGLVDVQTVKGQELVLPHPDGFVPAAGSAELVALFAANLGDHAAGAVGNLLGEGPRLEQSVFADGLSAESVEHLAEFARRLWTQARADMIAEASRCYEADRARPDAHHRMRFGAFYWDQDNAGDTTDGEACQPAPAIRAKKTASPGRGDPQ